MAKLYSLKEIHNLEQTKPEIPNHSNGRIPSSNLDPRQKFLDELTLWKTAMRIEIFEKEDFQIK